MLTRRELRPAACFRRRQATLLPAPEELPVDEILAGEIEGVKTEVGLRRLASRLAARHTGTP